MGRNQQNSDLDSNQIIYEAVRKIAFHRYINDSNGTFRNTERVTGYVAKIHNAKDDELCGTIDVQEFNIDKSQNNNMQEGYHEGVLLSAIQNNKDGMLTLPMLYSEVVIATDPVSLKEYVTLFSHVDVVQIDSHQNISIGVTETDAFDDTSEDTPDFDELEKTGIHAHTSFTKNSINSQVVGAKGDKGAKTSSQLISDINIELKHNKATVTLDENKISQKFGDNNEVILNDQQTVIKSPKIFLGADSATEPAVLGTQLADLLIEFMDVLSQITTTTQLGPQPPMNMAKFIAMKAKIISYKTSISGFLSKTVKVK